MPRARAVEIDPDVEWWDARKCAAKVGLKSFRSWYDLAERSLTLREAHRTVGRARRWLSTGVRQFLQFPDVVAKRRGVA